MMNGFAYLGFRIGAGLLAVACTLALACHSVFAAGSPKAVLMLLETNPWLMVIGSDSPVFTLYDDGTVIFKENSGDDRKPRFRFSTVKLSCAERDKLLAEVSWLEKAKASYQVSNVTDQPANVFYLNNSGDGRNVRVYGNLARAKGNSETGERKQAPPELISIFDRLHYFKHQNSKPWLPEKIEVMIWPFEYSKDKPLRWPSNWPDLNDKHTVKRSANNYSIFLPSAHFQKLQALLGKMPSTTAMRMNGKKWAVSYRLPIPDEKAPRTNER